MLLLFISLAYLLGSIPMAIVVCHFCGLPDPRQQGSGNPGASNVLRLGGQWLALLVLVSDGLKGLLPVVVAKASGVAFPGLGWIALSAFLGHLFPLFFRFRGGKGVATALGGLWALAWPVALLALATWLIVLGCFRYVSLASIIAAVVSSLVAIVWVPYDGCLAIWVMGIALIGRHCSNIQRLCNRTENKLKY